MTIGPSTAATWGISGEQFLWDYGVLCATASVWILYRWQRALGPRGGADDAPPDLGLHDLALLSGGTQHAITTAAVQLHRDGLLDIDYGTLRVRGELQPTADAFERAVFETVRAAPGMTSDVLRVAVAETELARSATAELTRAGLLLDEPQTVRLRRLWLVGAAIAVLGIVRLAAGLPNGAPVGLLVAMVVAVLYATFRLARSRPLPTTRGRAILRRWRNDCAHLRKDPVAAEVALTAALFGGAALWLADPAIASGLGIPREDGTRRSGWSSGGEDGDGGGGDGGGCGGCGGCG
jgi:uncharacterized protein (TIGR04222 family)